MCEVVYSHHEWVPSRLTCTESCRSFTSSLPTMLLYVSLLLSAISLGIVVLKLSATVQHATIRCISFILNVSGKFIAIQTSSLYGYSSYCPDDMLYEVLETTVHFHPRRTSFPTGKEMLPNSCEGGRIASAGNDSMDQSIASGPEPLLKCEWNAA